MGRIGFKADVEGTLWTLADLPGANLFALHKGMLQRQAVTIFLLFLLFSGVMAALIRKFCCSSSLRISLLSSDRNTCPVC